MKKVLNINHFNKRLYHELRKPDDKKLIPWRYVQVPKDENNPNIQVGVFNRWKALFPPHPIVLLHGLTGNHRELSTLIRSSNYPYGIISMDLRSYGGSGKSFASNKLSDHASDFLRVLKHFRLSHASVIGYGFGGHVALKLAEEHPHKIGNIVLVNSGGNTFSEEVKKNYTQNINTLCQSYENVEDYLKNFEDVSNIDLKSKLTYDHKQIDEFKISRISKTVALQNLKNMEIEYPEEEKLWRIRHPITIVKSQFGFKEKEENVLLPEEEIEKMKKILNIKKVLTIKRTNHQNILYNEDSSSQIMKEMENLMSETDKHRKIEKFVESLRTREEANYIEETFFKSGPLSYLKK
eukprot:gene11592-4835_t